MAVTNQNSTEYGYATSSPVTFQTSANYGGKTRIFRFTHTQSGAGDANSTVNLVLLPAGKYSIIAGASKVYNSAFGTSRTLDVGHAAYTKYDGTAVVANDDAFASAIAVATAGSFAPDDELTATGGVFAMDTASPVAVFATVEGGTIPDGATLTGYIVVQFD